MKKIIVLLFFHISLSLFGRTYYVSPTGNNTNPGTIDAPFATWERLGDFLVAGDTGYILGGTYRCKKPVNSRYICYFHDLSGTPGNLIKIWAYPGETPILNFDDIQLTLWPFLLFLKNCDYVHIKGLRITGALQPPNTSLAYGILLNDSNYNIIENCTVDHIGGQGIEIGFAAYPEDGNTEPSEYNLFLNCDVFDISNPLGSDPYGGSNGFNLTWNQGKASHTTFRGCRAWFCSDDGFDFYRGDNVDVRIENCWSFWNGYVDGEPGKFGAYGNGFKLGPNSSLVSGINTILSNCIAAENHNGGGFSVNGITGVTVANNCLSVNNSGFAYMWGWDGQVAHVLRNCIGFYSDLHEDNFFLDEPAPDLKDLQYNNFNATAYGRRNPYIDIPKTSQDDFVSLDANQLVRPRKSDGSLPDIDFGHLVPGSKLIDAGINVGLPYTGTAPDIGAFEITFGASAAIPEYIDSFTENRSPSIIEINYNLSLDASSVPSFNDFVVKVNSKVVGIIYIKLERSKVYLTLEDPVEMDDVVLISYNKPITNFLKTIYGGEAASIFDKKVTNKVGYNNTQKLIMALIYPNPAKDYFDIKILGDPPVDILYVRLFNAAGKLIKDTTINPGSSNYRININLIPGVYLMQIGSGILTFLTQKLVVTK